MDDFLGAALGASASSLHVQFAAFVIMGLAVGGALGRARSHWAWSPALAIMGVCGAWLGAEVYCLFGQAERGSGSEFVAAFLGALWLAYVWRRYHPEAQDERTDIAVPRINA